MVGPGGPKKPSGNQPVPPPSLDWPRASRAFGPNACPIELAYIFGFFFTFQLSSFLLFINLPLSIPWELYPISTQLWFILLFFFLCLLLFLFGYPPSTFLLLPRGLNPPGPPGYWFVGVPTWLFGLFWSIPTLSIFPAWGGLSHTPRGYYIYLLLLFPTASL